MKIITTVASLNGQSAEHYKMVADIDPAGLVVVTHESNVALARNKCLTEVVRWVGWDVCLMIDDDVFASSGDWKVLCSEAARTGKATCGLYPTAEGKLHYMISTSDDGAPCLLTGLGALAIPRERLEAIAREYRQVRLSNGEDELVIPFTRSAVGQQATWWNEDFWLCHRLGGVSVHPTVRPTHRKLGGKQLSADALSDAREGLIKLCGDFARSQDSSQ